MGANPTLNFPGGMLAGKFATTESLGRPTNRRPRSNCHNYRRSSGYRRRDRHNSCTRGVQSSYRRYRRRYSFAKPCNGSTTTLTLVLEKAGKTAQTIISEGGAAIAVAGDITDNEAIRNLVERTAEFSGGEIHIIVNNAGYAWDDPIEKIQDKQWGEPLPCPGSFVVALT